MNKLFSVLLIAAITAMPACCVSNSTSRSPTGLNMAQHLERQTVAMDEWRGVVGVDGDGDPIMGIVDPAEDPEAELQVYCSGVWVTDDVFVTAQHCVDHLGKPPLTDEEKMLRSLGIQLPGTVKWDPTGQPLTYSVEGEIVDSPTKIRSTHTAVVLASDPDHDLALVRVTGDVNDVPKHENARLATSVREGDDAHIMGHPGGLLWSYYRGVVAAIRPHETGPHEVAMDTIQVSAPVWFGNSGGGAFNQDGQLIGIASWIRKIPNVAFFVKFTEVNKLLDANKIIR